MIIVNAPTRVKDAPGVAHMGPYVLPIAAGILVALFMVQSRGTASMAKFFGPITAVWFVTIAGLGVFHISDDLTILRALSPQPLSVTLPFAARFRQPPIGNRTLRLIPISILNVNVWWCSSSTHVGASKVTIWCPLARWIQSFVIRGRFSGWQ